MKKISSKDEIWIYPKKNSRNYTKKNTERISSTKKTVMTIVALWRIFSTPRRSNLANSPELEIPRLRPDCFGWRSTRSTSTMLVMMRRVVRMWERLIRKTIEKRKDCMQNYKNSKENNKSRKLPLIGEWDARNIKSCNETFQKSKEKEITTTTQCQSSCKWEWFSREKWLKQKSSTSRHQWKRSKSLNTTINIHTIKNQFDRDPIA